MKIFKKRRSPPFDCRCCELTMSLYFAEHPIGGEKETADRLNNGVNPSAIIVLLSLLCCVPGY